MDGDSNELAVDWGGDDGSESGSAVGDRSRSPTLCPGRSRPPQRLLALTSSAWRPPARLNRRPRRARGPAPPDDGSAVGDDGSSAVGENRSRFFRAPESRLGIQSDVGDKRCAVKFRGSQLLLGNLCSSANP